MSSRKNRGTSLPTIWPVKASTKFDRLEGGGGEGGGDGGGGGGGDPQLGSWCSHQEQQNGPWV